MSDCQHEQTTIDCVCTDCGYDLIVDARDDKIRKQERERIIWLIEIQRDRAIDVKELKIASHLNYLIAMLKKEKNV